VTTITGLSRTQRVLRNAGAVLLQFGVSTAVSFFAVPYVLRALGRENYGQWVLLTQAVNYLAMIDFGNPSVAKIALAGHAERGESERFSVLLAEAGRSILITTPVTLIGGVLISCVMCANGSRANGCAELAIAVAILTGAYCITRFMAIPRFALFGANIEFRSALPRTVALASQGVLDIVAACLGSGLIGFALNRLISQLLALMELHRAAKRYIPFYRFALLGKSRGISDLLAQNVPCVVVQWGLTLTEGSDILLLGLCGATDYIAPYAITCTVPRLLFTMATPILNSAHSSITSLYATSNYAATERARLVQEVGLLATLSIGGTCYLVFGKSFVELWVGPGLFAGLLVAMLGLGSQYVIALTRNNAAMLASTMDYHYGARALTIGTVASLGIAACVTHACGPAAGLASLLMLKFCTNQWLSGRICKTLGCSYFEYLQQLARPVAFAISSVAIGALLSNHFSIRAWLQVLALGITLAAALLFTFLGTALNRDQRRVLWDRLSKVL
jgi:O-antigen/teichoic acid export membrane protein